ncbi:hypothetical protein KUTeg_011653 [Tegillarca granosa]|uniref:Uncharacterized protein n=1 Tax=Tegillarca granosa TaxID=220873 RepID=A0ABQ9EX86_TEGGR|nr:hypothetical protein KUTeg_011653 [Tegillarca granosa]
MINPNLPKGPPKKENDKFADLVWPKYDLSRQQYLQFENKFSIMDSLKANITIFKYLVEDIKISQARKKPLLKHHYRGKELSVWLNLLPKINKPDPSQKGTNPDPFDHLLKQSNNISSFDDYSRLLSNFHRIFPSPPPIPPMTPIQGDGTSASTHVNKQDPGGIKVFPQKSTNRPPVSPSDVTQEEPVDTTTAAPVNVASQQDASLAHSSVPLSIVVAVGCSLLFLNILIFAGVYYQRERIKKLKATNRNHQEELRNSRKPEREIGDPGGHETTGLMDSSQPNQLSPVKIVNTKPDIQNNPIYSAISKPQDSCTVSYAYTAVPTSSSSPMHRQRTHHSQCNSTSQPFKTGSTFGDISGRPPDRPSPKTSDRDRNTYKQDKLNQITSKEHKSSNNAITIV